MLPMRMVRVPMLQLAVGRMSVLEILEAV